MESETIGDIKRIRKDRKAVDLGFDSWYQSFKEISQDFKIGDSVRIVFNENKVDDKVFKNIKIMTKIKPEPVKEMIAYDFKPKQIMTKEALGLNNELTPTDKNAILITATNIYLDKDNSDTLECCIERVKNIRLKL